MNRNAKKTTPHFHRSKTGTTTGVTEPASVVTSPARRRRRQQQQEARVPPPPKATTAPTSFPYTTTPQEPPQSALVSAAVAQSRTAAATAVACSSRSTNDSSRASNNVQSSSDNREEEEDDSTPPAKKNPSLEPPWPSTSFAATSSKYLMSSDTSPAPPNISEEQAPSLQHPKRRPMLRSTVFSTDPPHEPPQPALVSTAVAQSRAASAAVGHSSILSHNNDHRQNDHPNDHPTAMKKNPPVVPPSLGNSVVSSGTGATTRIPSMLTRTASSPPNITDEEDQEPTSIFGAAHQHPNKNPLLAPSSSTTRMHFQVQEPGDVRVPKYAMVIPTSASSGCGGGGSSQISNVKRQQEDQQNDDLLAHKRALWSEASQLVKVQSPARRLSPEEQPMVVQQQQGVRTTGSNNTMAVPTGTTTAASVQQSNNDLLSHKRTSMGAPSTLHVIRRAATPPSSRNPLSFQEPASTTTNIMGEKNPLGGPTDLLAHKLRDGNSSISSSRSQVSGLSHSRQPGAFYAVPTKSSTSSLTATTAVAGASPQHDSSSFSSLLAHKRLGDSPVLVASRNPPRHNPSAANITMTLTEDEEDEEHDDGGVLEYRNNQDIEQEPGEPQLQKENPMLVEEDPTVTSTLNDESSSSLYLAKTSAIQETFPNDTHTNNLPPLYRKKSSRRSRRALRASRRTDTMIDFRTYLSTHEEKIEEDTTTHHKRLVAVIAGCLGLVVCLGILVGIVVMVVLSPFESNERGPNDDSNTVDIETPSSLLPPSVAPTPLSDYMTTVRNALLEIVSPDLIASSPDSFELAIRWYAQEQGKTSFGSDEEDQDVLTSVQRFVLIWLWFHWTQNGSNPWKSCNPTLDEAVVDEDATCTLETIVAASMNSLSSQMDFILSPLVQKIPRQIPFMSHVHHECDWVHVECASIFQARHVTGLKLLGNGITGEFPLFLTSPELLPHLQSLVIWNDIWGTLPSQIGRMQQLTHLKLVGTKLTGPIPEELYNLTNLHQLVVAKNNQLTGTISRKIGQLVNAAHMEFTANSGMSGTDGLPTEVGLLSSHLKVLQCHQQKLRSTIPSELGQLTNLEYLSLALNGLTGALPAETLGNLTALGQLHLWSNQLKGKIPGLHLPSVTDLRLEGNLFTGPLPESLFAGSPNMRDFRVHHNKLRGALSDAIGNWENLELLYLRDNRFTGVFPPEALIHNLTNLQEMSVANNYFKGPFPEVVCTRFRTGPLEVFESRCAFQGDPTSPICTCCDPC